VEGEAVVAEATTIEEEEAAAATGTEADRQPPQAARRGHPAEVIPTLENTCVISRAQMQQQRHVP